MVMLAVGSIGFTISANSATPKEQPKEAKVEKDKKNPSKLSAQELFKKASKLYESSDSEEDRKQAFELALEGAKKKHAESQLLVSLMYEIGEGVELDTEEAEKWRNEAAKNGSIDAKGIIAVMNIAQDLDQLEVAKFKPLAEEAYKSGSAFGLAAMAYVIHDGYGVEADKKKGQELLMQAMSKPYEALNFFERIYLPDIQELVLEIE